MSAGIHNKPKHRQHEIPLKMYEVYEGNGGLLYATTDSYDAIEGLQDDDYIVLRIWEPKPDSTPELHPGKHRR